MCITIDESIDQHTREYFETVLPDGSVSPAFIDAEGRYVAMPGLVDNNDFAQEANALLSMSTAAGLLEEDARLHGEIIDAQDVMHIHVRPELDESGQLSLDWNVVVGAPGVIEITMFEA
jgi:hypothetical protein